MDTCFDLVGSRQHGVASNEIISWSTDRPAIPIADRQKLSRRKIMTKPMNLRDSFVCQRSHRGNDMIFWIFPVVLCRHAFHLTLANLQEFGFELHLRSSPSAFSRYGWSVDQLITSLLATLDMKAELLNLLPVSATNGGFLIQRVIY